MIKTRYTLPGRVFAITLGVLLFSFSILIAFSRGPLPARTGAPGEQTCFDGCHNSFVLDTGTGSFSISGLPAAGYVPGDTSDITIAFSGTAGSIFGFEAVVLTSGGSPSNAGTLLENSPNMQIIISSGKKYIEHNIPSSTGSWNFKWIAPGSDIGKVTIYAAGNAANGNGNNQGDYIYTATHSASAAVVTSVEDDMFTPNRFKLHDNYPNPFNPETTIAYDLEKAGRVTIRIYDLLGRVVRTLVDVQQSSGAYSVKWDGKDNNGRQAATGTYIVRMKSGRQSDTIKMVLIR